MKSIGYLAVVPKFHGLWTTLICVSLLSGGWQVKRALQIIDANTDGIEESCRYPSPVCSAKQNPARLQYLQHQREKQPATQATDKSTVSPVPGHERVE